LPGFKFELGLEFMRANTICVVDDDTYVLRSLKELLASDDLEAETFDDPQTFLDYVRAHPVELAVLDVWMPAQTGIQLQELLLILSPQTKVIIITGQEDPAIRTVAVRLGALAFLVKPFDDETFLAAVHRAVYLKR
jgi:two-component system response regulator FixJ